MTADGGDEGNNWGGEEEDTYLRLGAGVQDDRAIQTLVSLCWERMETFPDWFNSWAASGLGFRSQPALYYSYPTLQKNNESLSLSLSVI